MKAPAAHTEQIPAAGFQKILFKAFFEEWQLYWQHINAQGLGRKFSTDLFWTLHTFDHVVHLLCPSVSFLVFFHF